jgi:hypothetical protein
MQLQGGTQKVLRFTPSFHFWGGNSAGSSTSGAYVWKFLAWVSQALMMVCSAGTSYAARQHLVILR